MRHKTRNQTLKNSPIGLNFEHVAYQNAEFPLAPSLLHRTMALLITMKTLQASLYCLLALMFLQTPLFAWSAGGHQAVAAIAWDKMSPTARAKAAKLLRTAPNNSRIRALRPNNGTDEEKDRVQFIRTAVWADEVRSPPRDEIYHRRDWHFTDYFWEQPADGSAPIVRDDLKPDGELTKKLPEIEASLKEMNSDPVSPSKSTDLAWLIHLMGDISQPLHCSGRIAVESPKGDQGGNLFCVSPHLNSRGQCAESLHSYWDHAVEKKYGQNPDITAVAADLQKNYSPGWFTRMRLGQYEQWAQKARETAMNELYPTTLAPKQEPSDEYFQKMSDIAMRSIALAGYRLGETLNEIFPDEIAFNSTHMR